jgi:hypothetical protein
MRGLTVQGSTGSGIKPMEIRRGRHRHGCRLQHEPRLLRQIENAILTSVDLLGLKAAHIADGWCVDEAEQPLRCVAASVRVVCSGPTILSADVNGRCGRHLPRTKDLVELFAVVAREEDIVP